MPTAEKNKPGSSAQPLVILSPNDTLEMPWKYSTTSVVPEMALYYGFSPIERMLGSSIKLEKQDEQLANELADRVGSLFSLREKIALLRRYFAKNVNAVPLAVFSEKNLQRRGDHPTVEYHLDVVGTARPTAEALLMKLCYEIARQQYAPEQEVVLEINSVGERESFSRFSRDITAHFRKHLESLNADCRHAFKKSAFAAVSCTHTECQQARETMPESVSFLSEPSRRHFMEVLEHLEAAGVPYALDKDLIVEPDIVQHSVFRVSALPVPEPEVAHAPFTSSLPSLVPPTIIARGSRWGGLARRMGFKKDVLGASAIVRMPARSTKKATTAPKPQKKMTPPAFYFIHIGHDALLKSLNVIEDLRRAKIAVHHALLKDKMSGQLGSAEYLGVPYILIMGQRESVDGTVLVRQMITRSQETVPLPRLVDYIRKLLH